jgi:hypothetical protein
MEIRTGQNFVGDDDVMTMKMMMMDKNHYDTFHLTA